MNAPSGGSASSASFGIQPSAPRSSCGSGYEATASTCTGLVTGVSGAAVAYHQRGYRTLIPWARNVFQLDEHAVATASTPSSAREILTHVIRRERPAGSDGLRFPAGRE